MPVIPILPAFGVSPPKAQPPMPPPDLVVTAKSQSIDTARQIIVYTEGVVATFDPTVISADRLEVHRAPDEEFGEATGHVKIVDPDGTITADHLIFNWKNHTGQGDKIFIDLGETKIWADHIDLQSERRTTTLDKNGKPHVVVTPARWSLTGVSYQGCAKPLGSYTFRTSSVVIVPGKSGTAYRPVLYFGNKKIVQLPTHRFSLDRRNQGIGMPVLAINRDFLGGITWGGGLLFNDQTSFNFGTALYQGHRPTGQISIARSFVSAEKNPSPIFPTSEFGERFSGGYFDNIGVDEFAGEEILTRRPKFTIGAASYLHVGTGARLRSSHFDVPLELSAERTFASKDWGLSTIARVSSLHEDWGETDYRLNTQVTLSPPRLKLFPGLFGVSRLDSASFTGTKSNYGWARAQGGLLFEPNKTLSLGAVYYDSVEGGRPQFDMDPLTSKAGIAARLDLRLGSTRLGYLLKYDQRRGSIFDREYTLHQAIGCFEAFVTYRRFPSSYALGLMLRTDGIFDRLHRRTVDRTKQVQRMPEMGH